MSYYRFSTRLSGMEIGLISVLQQLLWMHMQNKQTGVCINNHGQL